ncbi:MAG: hypothetical protein ACK5L7_07005 [Paludibacteraceae bacterium]
MAFRIILFFPIFIPMFRKSLFALIPILFFFVLQVYSQPKRKIYITLDTSGSMYGDKYMIGNYTAQFISLILPDDDIYMIINGVVKKISGNPNSYRQIQINYSLIRSQWGVSPLGTQIGDLIAFNNTYSLNINSEQWLIIIGDGNWESYKYPAVLNRFSENAGMQNLNIFFIPYGNINDGHSDFIDFIRLLKSPKILNESRQFRNVMNNCIILYAYLTGNSGRDVKISKINDKTVKIISPFPVKKYVLFYQDETSEQQILQPNSAKQDSVNYAITHIGTPSTAPICYGNNRTMLSGTLWSITGPKPLEADIPTIITFDKPVDMKKIIFFPRYDLNVKQENIYLETKPVLPVKIAVSNESDFREKLSKNEFIKNNIDKDLQKMALGQRAMSNTKPENEEAIILSESTLSKIDLQKHKNNDSVLIYTAKVKLKENIDTAKYRLEIKHNKMLILKKTTWKTDSNTITLSLEQRAQWSENLMPDTLHLTLSLFPQKHITNNSETFSKQKFEIRASAVTKKNHTRREYFMPRLLIVTIILLIYLIAISIKARFKRGAVLDYYSQNWSDQTILRKRGFLSWFNRWFNPFGSEKREVIFYNVSKTITFKSSQTKYSIRFDANDFDNEIMSYKEYSPKKYGGIEFVENRELIIKNNKNKISIKYDSLSSIRDDRPWFRGCTIGLSLLIIGLLILI